MKDGEPCTSRGCKHGSGGGYAKTTDERKYGVALVLHHAALPSVWNIREKHLQHFDAWASTFGETVTALEIAPEGTDTA